MREVSSERYKNFYPGNTSGIYQHRRGTADFLSGPSQDSLRVARLLALSDRDKIRKTCDEVNYPFSEAEVSRLKASGLPCVPRSVPGVTYPVGETLVKAKQWAFGLRPIHLSRGFEREW
ncbi:Uncharacterized protein DBV15_10649 [Temnothorax longispinosus]|uniref:Uncharacterized protein n=1 Tax=Temnothorax longispinosus TaxID=300112 RepID=A0A4S2JRK5_9HYME|nr:Uncharacterized protein DBV15_10649 [Temnothorax longispinosus]